ncbi:MAG: glycosyltransferase family 2 protein [Rhodothermales bacterium]
MAKVSVIVIFLDAIDYLLEAVESVRAQTLQDWELILVDDGSTDGGSAMARDLAAGDPLKIRYVDHPGHANLGMSASRNAGVRLARGRYVAFLDADDRFLPDRLSSHVAILEDNDELAAVQGCLWYWKSWTGGADEREIAPLGTYQGVVQPPRLLDLLLRTRGGTAPGICSLTVKRETFLQLGGCEQAFKGLFEDQVLWSKLYLAHAIHVTSEPTVLYRQRADSSTGRAGEAGLTNARLTYLEWLGAYLESLPIVPCTTRDLLAASLTEYRRPLLAALQRLPGNLLAESRRIGLAGLPAPLAQRTVKIWRRYKHRRHQRRLKDARMASGLPSHE